MAFFKNHRGSLNLSAKKRVITKDSWSSSDKGYTSQLSENRQNTNGKEALKQPPLDYVNYFLAEISLILDSH